ncbi:MAG: N-acetylmuramoyl-L-alanine amidase [Myxococcota bacterium]
MSLLIMSGCDPTDARVAAPDPIVLAEEAELFPSGTEPDPIDARLRDIRIFGADTRASASARVVLVFDGAPLFEQERLPSTGTLPERVAIRLLRTAYGKGLRPLTEVDAGGIARVRLSSPEPRVVVDLEPGAEGRVFYLTDPYRIVIDVTAQRDGGSEDAPPVIVLDPGHGGSEPGAANDAFDLVESTVALDIAKLTRERLLQILPGARVMLTREDNSGLSLEARCALANSVEADVFVSIHLNAGAGEVTTGGVTTFVLDTNNDRQALRLAARENGTRVASVTGMQRILAAHHRRGQARESLALADAIQRSTLGRGRRVVSDLGDRGVRSAMFYVLVGAKMPAVLVEASFLTFEPEARALTTKRYRRELASGIASGIASFLGAR